MPTQNLLATIMNTIKLSERRGKKTCFIDGSSKFAGSVLNVMQRSGYIGEYEYIDNGRGGNLRIQLLGRVNECGIIVPRVSVSPRRIERLAAKYLPSKDIGVLIVSTSQGAMSHIEARNKDAGGVAVAFIY
jgi:small subunit ribosomal protein S8